MEKLNKKIIKALIAGIITIIVVTVSRSMLIPIELELSMGQMSAEGFDTMKYMVWSCAKGIAPYAFIVSLLAIFSEEIAEFVERIGG